MEHNRIVYEKPYDAEVEYLESTGTQWIDTGIVPDSEHKYEVTVSKTADNTAEVVPLGSWNAWQNAMFGSDIKNSTVGIYLLWGGGSHQTNIITNDWITLYGEKGLSKATLISTGEILAAKQFSATFTCNQSAYLFALNRNGSVVYRGSCKISRAKIWNGDTLVRDFIPVRIGLVGYMYDKVSGKLFANQGTDNFSLGSDVANPIPNIRRVFLFDNKRFVVPSGLVEGVDYQRYDWLKKSGLARIDIPTNYNMVDSVTCYFKHYGGTNGQMPVFGGDKSHGLLWQYSNGGGRLDTYFVSQYFFNIQEKKGKFKVQFNWQTKKMLISWNDVSKGGWLNCAVDKSNTKISVLDAAMFNQSWHTHIGNLAMKYFYLAPKIYLTPCQLLRSIPAKYDAKGIARHIGECGMIDLLSGKFYGNVASSGSFTVENDND